jgi:hypothetical protein
MEQLGIAGETYRSSSSRKTLQSGVFARSSCTFSGSGAKKPATGLKLKFNLFSD